MHNTDPIKDEIKTQREGEEEEAETIMNPNPLVVVASKKSAASSTATPTLRKAIWELYVGVGIKEAPCPLCWLTRIQNNVNSGFECAHVVARNWMTEELSVYYIFPSCSVCNNECRDMCVLDYLYARQRIGPLRKIVMIIYQRYLVEYEHEWALENRMIHLVLDHLYGPRRFPSAGGILNRKQIYEIARTEQYQWLLEQGVELERQMCDLQKQRRWLLEENIKPMRLE
ncbi:MAG: hypothetical protein ABIP54_04975 [Candidatus Andersenbacteria bacterium]